MFCTVYQLRRDGERLPPEEVMKTKVMGYLQLGRRRPRSPEIDARLMDGNGELILLLKHAQLVKVDQGGMMLQGLYEVSYNQHVRQSWWVLPTSG